MRLSIGEQILQTPMATLVPVATAQAQLLRWGVSPAPRSTRRSSKLPCCCRGRVLQKRLNIARLVAGRIPWLTAAKERQLRHLR